MWLEDPCSLHDPTAWLPAWYGYKAPRASESPDCGVAERGFFFTSFPNKSAAPSCSLLIFLDTPPHVQGRKNIQPFFGFVSEEQFLAPSNPPSKTSSKSDERGLT